MTRKTLIYSSVILIIFALALGAYYFLLRTNENALSGIKPSFSNFFPFGGGTNVQTSTTTDQNIPIEQPNVNLNYQQRLRLISNEPVAGATFMETKQGSMIRYIEKATGHIFDVSTYSADTSRISNTTIPKIYQAYFTEKGSGFIARYISDNSDIISSIYAKIPSIGTTTDRTISGTPVLANVESVSISPTGNNLFSLEKSHAGSVGIISSPNNTNRKQIWDSRIQNLIPHYLNDNQILLTTKPNASVPGYAYMVNTKNGSVTTILQDLPDLSILVNPTGTNLIFSTSASGRLYYYIIATGVAIELSPKTLPEKCVFDQGTIIAKKDALYCAVPKNSINGNSLDNWYMGKETFSDEIWKYNLKDNTAQRIADIKSEGGRDVDAIHLQLNSTSGILMFESKTDGSLWSLKLD